MSDLLNQASLVMIPSGYKEDTVFSQIPQDGSGDLAFTRASNGTRVNSAGLVEVCPWNLVTNSENFSADFAPINSSISNNTTTAPNGTTTADSLIEDTATDSHFAYADSTQLTGTQYTYSLYAKSIGGRNIKILGSSGFGGNVVVDLANGSVLSGSGVVENVGNGWYRISITATTTTTTVRVILYTVSGTNTTYTGNGTSGVYLWGAQLNIGSTAKPYFPTTDRLNVPRLTYQNGGGGCPSLLLEKQSTNTMLNSENLDSWLKLDTSVTSNSATSPDGTQNADTVTATGSGSLSHLIYQNLAFTSGTAYTLSVFAKANTSNFIQLVFAGNLVANSYANFDLSNGTITASANLTPKIESMGGGWFRCSVSATAGTSSTNSQIIYLINSGTASRAEAFTANGESVYLWGGQFEASSYPTSYIPTTSSSATRVADAMTVNLPNTNMTFTAYLECEEAPLATTAGDWFAIFNNVSPLGRAYGYSNLFGFADLYSVGETSAPKMVWKQESGTTAKIFKNGVLVGTSTTGAYALAFNRFAIYAQFLDKPLKVKQFVFFDNALTDAECAQLTA